MRRIIFFLALMVLARQLALAQDLSEFRPALIGRSPGAIINRIDTKMLIAAGQKDAAVMFCAVIEKNGDVVWRATYRGTADSKLLDQEVQRALLNGKMIPAIRNRQLVSVFYCGTVTFSVIDKKPRLRIFANQEAAELKSENDFIGPQPCLGGDSKFSGLHYPAGSDAPLPVSGAVELRLKIDAQGNLLEKKVVFEDPPLLGFGQSAMDDFADAKFIPAFRNGQPVVCEITLPLYYKPKR
jgi:hypothetical protein